MGPITGPLLVQFLRNIADCEDVRHALLHRRQRRSALLKVTVCENMHGPLRDS